MKKFGWFIVRLATAYIVASTLFIGVLEVGLLKTGVIASGSFIDVLLKLIFGVITASIFLNKNLLNWFKVTDTIALYSIAAFIVFYLGILTVVLPYIVTKTLN